MIILFCFKRIISIRVYMPRTVLALPIFHTLIGSRRDINAVLDELLNTFFTFTTAAEEMII